jgi:hypothetical protein
LEYLDGGSRRGAGRFRAYQNQVQLHRSDAAGSEGQQFQGAMRNVLAGHVFR